MQLQLAHNKILTVPNDFSASSSANGTTSDSSTAYCCCCNGVQQQGGQEPQGIAAAAAGGDAAAAAAVPQGMCAHCRQLPGVLDKADSSSSTGRRGGCCFVQLRVLDLGGNALKEVGDVVGVLGCPGLEQLWLGETPLAAHGKKRQALWQVGGLDGNLGWIVSAVRAQGARVILLWHIIRCRIYTILLVLGPVACAGCKAQQWNYTIHVQ